MRQLLTLIALVAGTLFPVAGAFGAPAPSAPVEPAVIGVRLADAPVATRDDPRARVYIIDHVRPGTTIERRIEVSNDTGAPADIAVYPAAAELTGGSFVGLEGDTPNELSSWTDVSTPRVRLADGADRMVTVTIDVPADAAPGEQYAVLWAQTSSTGDAAIKQVSRVGIRVYLSVGPGGAPASSFEIESLTARRDPSGAPEVTATVRNTGGRALDLRGDLTLRDGPGGLSAGPFPVTLGTSLGLDETAPAAIELDEELPNGPWRAKVSITSGLLTETATASLTFPDSGTGETVTVSDGTSPWVWGAGGLTGVVLLAAAGRLSARRRAAVPLQVSSSSDSSAAGPVHVSS